ncbi:MAG: hypothetical protein IAE64_01115 [Flavobacteriales bacterium]|nr:hypothetical protein [Flavobacteriales bacterium]
MNYKISPAEQRERNLAMIATYDVISEVLTEGALPPLASIAERVHQKLDQDLAAVRYAIDMDQLLKASGNIIASLLEKRGKAKHKLT